METQETICKWARDTFGTARYLCNDCKKPDHYDLDWVALGGTCPCGGMLRIYP